MPGRRRSGLAQDRRAYSYVPYNTILESLFPPPPPPPTYIVTYNGNTNINGNAPVDSSSYAAGSNVIVLGNTGNLTKTNNTFSGWNTQADGLGVSYLSGTSFTMPNSNITLFAKWTLTTYKVIYNKNASAATGSITDTSSYMPGTIVSVKSDMGLKNIGNTFANWNTSANNSGTPYSSGDTFPITANITLYAQWNVNSYTLTYHKNALDADGTPPSSQTHNYGASINIEGNTGIPSITKTGHAFTAWNTLVSGLGTSYSFNAPFTMPAQDTTLYADWKQTFKLTYDKNANTATGQVPQDDLSYIAGTAATILQNPSQTPLSNTGYTFAGWTDNSSGTGRIYNNPDKFTITPNATLYAKWNINNYSVTYYKNADDATGTPPSLQTAAYSSSINIQGTGTLSRQGYVFTAWNAAADGTGTSYTIGQQFTIPATNTKLYAQWTPTYTMTYSNNNSVAYPNATGTITDSLSYITGSNVSVKSDAGFLNTGYSFSGWNIQANGLGTSYTIGQIFPITANTTLYAQWTPTYTMSYNNNSVTYPNATGTITDTLSYITGSNVSVKSDAGFTNTGYSFSGWNIQANGLGTSYTIGQQFPIAANTTLYAQWSVNSYSVTYYKNADDATGNPPSLQTANYNTIVSVQETGTLSRQGYAFTTWNTQVDGNGTSYTIGQQFPMPAQDTKLYAQWTPTYTMTYSNNNSVTYPNATGTITDTLLYITGSNVSVKSDAGFSNTNYAFNGWNTSANNSGTSYTIGQIFSITANTTLYAQWIPTYTISYYGNTPTTGTAPTDNTLYKQGYNVTILENSGTLTKSGFKFTGWNARADGTGTTYIPNTTFPINANISLYAKWSQTYNFSYNGNTPTTGTVPTDNLSPYIAGDEVIILGNTGNLSRTNYKFTGWNTLNNGNGTTYLPGDKYIMLSIGETLFAKWTLSYAFSYNTNGATSGTLPTTATSYIAGEQVTILENTGNLTKSNNIFGGWNTRADGTGTTTYIPPTTFTMPAQVVTLYVKWTPTYTFKYDTNGATSGTLPTTETFSYLVGQQVTVLDNTGNLTKTNFIFNGWNAQANGLGTTIYTIGQDFSMPAATLTLYAKWRAIYTFRYDTNGATTGTLPINPTTGTPLIETVDYLAGETVTVLENTGNLAIPEQPGTTGTTSYIFDSWNTDWNGGGTNYIPPTTFAINASRILYVRWKALYPIAYDGNNNTGGTIPIDELSPYAVNYQVTIMANTGNLSKTGYTFSNWAYFADGGGNTAPLPGSTFKMPAKYTIFYAKWTAINYTLTYSKNTIDATTGTPPTDTTQYIYENNVTIRGNTGNLSRIGYTFTAWNTLENGTGTSYPFNDATFTMPASNTTLYAQWTLINYTVTYNNNDNAATGNVIDTSTYTYGNSVTFKLDTGLTNNGYTFAGWTFNSNGTGTLYNNPATFSINANTTLYAKWIVNSYTLTYDKNAIDATGTSPAFQTANYNTIVSVQGTGTLSRPSYALINWNTQADGLGTSYSYPFGQQFTMPAQDTILYAQWSDTTYTLTYDKNANTATGQVPQDNSSYLTNYLVSILQNPSVNPLSNTGYTFVGWTFNSNGTGTLYTTGNTFPIAANTRLYAKWIINNYTLTYAKNANDATGTPPSDTTQYNYNSLVSVQGTNNLSRTNFTFAGWNTVADITTGLGTLYTTGNTFSMPAANTTLYAQWTAYPTLYYDKNGGTGGSFSPTTQYAPGTTTSIIASPPTKTNYTFAGWNTDAQNGTGIYYANNSSSITIYNESITLYAQWFFNGSTERYQVAYAAGTGASGSPPTPNPVTNIKEYQLVTASNSTGTLLNPGLTFFGWNTMQNGTGNYYGIGATNVDATPVFNMPRTNLLLSAQWIDTSKPYKLTYNGNQSTGGAVPVGQLTYYSGATAALLNNNESLVRTGYSFIGWNTAADGTGISYPFNTPYQKYTPIVMTSHTTLFAKWVAGNLFKNSGSYEGIFADINDVTSLYYTSSVTSYRDPTNNTFTIIIPTYYNRYYGGPYGTGNGPDINGIGKLLSTYAQATISQITSGPNLGSYQIVATYITKGTTGTQTQTATLLLESIYWPTTETIASVTIPTTSLQPAQFNFNLSPSVVVPDGGYYNQLVRPGSGANVQCAAVQAFYINFNNNKTTRVAFGINPYIDTDPSYSFISNYARIEVANGTTPNPITGTFTPSVSTGVNTEAIIQ